MLGNIYHIGTIAFETMESKREPKSIGGISGYMVELINYTLSKGLKVGLIGKIFNFEPGNNIDYYEIQKKVTSTNRFLIYLFIKSFLIKIPANSIIHAHRPDHLAAFTFFRSFKSVLTLHGQQAHTINIRKSKIIRLIYQVLEKLAFRKATALIAVDQVTKDFYSKRYPQFKNKLCVIPTGVNNNLFCTKAKNPARYTAGFANNDKIIIYVGRIEPPKKIEDIIRAMKVLTEKSPVYKLVIVGDGVDMSALKTLVPELNLADNVIFLGVRKRNELPDLYSMADISVLYSGNEGSPLSVKESLACGIPVVANDVGDIATIIKNDFNGYIADSASIDDLSEKMMLAVENAEKMKLNCLESIKDFSSEKVSQQVIDLYYDVFNRK